MDDDIELTPVGPTDHVRGPADAPLTLIEYADFECPYCRAAQPIVEELERTFAGRLRFVFRRFPLREIHPHAEAAAEATEAAGAQGKFWEMHHAIFAHRGLRDADLRGYARDIGVPDVARFDRECREHTYLPVIDAAIAAAEASGVEGTPMFFLNGQPFEDEPTVAGLSAAFTEAMSTAGR